VVVLVRERRELGGRKIEEMLGGRGRKFLWRKEKRCWESEGKIALREMEKVWGREGEKRIWERERRNAGRER
jgi:hypothetical protein